MAENGVPVKALETRPLTLPGLDFYFSAYQELSYDRPVGLSTGAIPWSSITKWCELHGVHDINEITTVIRFIRKLEAADAEILERKSKT